MKISKFLSAIAATATAVSMIAVSASATNWANATYGDDNPDTGTIVSTSENSATIAAAVDGNQIKLSVHAKDLLDEENFEKVKSATWNVTYDFSKAETAGSWVGGGTYFVCKNSTGYDLGSYVEYGEDGPIGYTQDTVTVEDSAKFLLPTEVITADSELCFIDWSQADCNFASNNVTITISDLKFFDADGNEVAQKAYEGTASAPAAEEAPAAAETPAADNGAATTSASTGNMAVASIAAVMAVAGVAAIAAKKRK